MFEPLSRTLSLLSRVRRRVLLHRRPLAALAVGLAVWVGVQAATAPPPPTVAVWTAARDLGAGTVVGRGDLERAGFLPGAVPPGAVSDLRSVLGRPLAHAVGRGQPVAETMVVGERWLSGQGGDSVVPVRISDAAVVDLLRVGDEVDLLGTDVAGLASPGGGTDGATLLAEGARVVAIPRATADPVSSSVPGRLVLLAVPPLRVQSVTSAAASQFLSVSWSR